MIAIFDGTNCRPRSSATHRRRGRSC
jgi:hypothetical protein